MYVGVDVSLTSALVWAVSFTSCPLYPRGKNPSYHFVGGAVGPRTGLGDLERRKILPLPRFELRSIIRPARSQPLYRLLYPGSMLEKFTSQNPRYCCWTVTHYHINVNLRTRGWRFWGFIKKQKSYKTTVVFCVTTLWSLWDLCQSFEKF
jgi:hypothetical protein